MESFVDRIADVPLWDLCVVRLDLFEPQAHRAAIGQRLSHQYVDKFFQYYDAPHEHFELPLGIASSAFQDRLHAVGCLGMPGADARSRAGRRRQCIKFYSNPNSRQLLPVSRRDGGMRARCQSPSPLPQAAGAFDCLKRGTA